MKQKLLYLCIGMFLVLNQVASADVKLNASAKIIDFNAKKKFQYYKITNTGDSKAYVKLTIDKLIDLGGVNPSTGGF